MNASRELQVQVDDVYGCPGNCGGCVLSSSERRTGSPDMSAGTLDAVFARLHEYVGGIGRLDRLNLTFGIADHLLMDDPYLERIYRLGADLVEAADPREREFSAVFFTTSLIGRKERILARLERLSGIADAVPLIPVAVLDPALLHNAKYGAIYEGLILEAKRLFGKVDLSINLSDEAVRQITPEQLHDFAVENGFDEVTINWTPTLDNRSRTTGDMAFLTEWLLAFDRRLAVADRISSSFRPVLLRSVDAVMCASDGDLSVSRTASEIVPETVRRSIQIDHMGRLLPKLEAIGDVPHSERFGYEALGSVIEEPISSLLERGIPKVQARVVAAHARTRACAACDVAGICAATGFHVFNHVLRDTGSGRTGCPHVGQALLRHFHGIASHAQG